MPDVMAMMGLTRVALLEKIAGGAACAGLPTTARLTFAEPLESALPFATCFPAILIAALFWGTPCGLVVLVLSGQIAGHLFFDAGQSALFEPKGFIALGLFLVCRALIVITGQMARGGRYLGMQGFGVVRCGTLGGLHTFGV